MFWRLSLGVIILFFFWGVVFAIPYSLEKFSLASSNDYSTFIFLEEVSLL